MDIYELHINDGCILLYRSIWEPVKSNMYIIIKNNGAIVIDPNDNEEGIQLLRNKKIENVHLIVTHEHYDHILGINLFRESFHKVDLYCQHETAKQLENPRHNNMMLVAFVLAVQDSNDGGHRFSDFKGKYKTFKSHADAWFDESEKKIVAGLNFRFIHTPGHCPGSCCIEFGNYVFTGDSLLKDDPVILRFPESNKNDYYRITQPYLKGLHEGTIILPGHGDPFKIEESKYLWD